MGRRSQPPNEHGYDELLANKLAEVARAREREDKTMRMPGSVSTAVPGAEGRTMSRSQYDRLQREKMSRDIGMRRDY